MKGLFVLAAILMSSAASASTVECTGTWVADNTDFYLSAKLKAPYASWIEGVDDSFVPCGETPKLHKADYYLIYQPVWNPRSPKCYWPGGMPVELKVLAQEVSGGELSLGFSCFLGSEEICQAITINRKTGLAVFYDVTHGGQWMPTAEGVKCKFSVPAPAMKRHKARVRVS